MNREVFSNAVPAAVSAQRETKGRRSSRVTRKTSCDFVVFSLFWSFSIDPIRNNALAFLDRYGLSGDEARELV
jgi:hypothetical protein